MCLQIFGQTCGLVYILHFLFFLHTILHLLLASDFSITNLYKLTNLITDFVFAHTVLSYTQNSARSRSVTSDSDKLPHERPCDVADNNKLANWALKVFWGKRVYLARYADYVKYVLLCSLLSVIILNNRQFLLFLTTHP